MALDDHTFTTLADEAIDDLYQRLVRAAESHDMDVDFNSGALALEFENPAAKFVVSPNSPVKQIWVSAHSKSYKFDWDASRVAFTLSGPTPGQTLAEMMSSAVSQQLGAKVTL